MILYLKTCLSITSLASKTLLLLPLWKTSASILEGLFSPLSIFRVDAIGEEGRRVFLFYLFWVVLVDTHPYPAVHWRPDAKTNFDGKDLFDVAQAVHPILWLLRIFFLSALLNFWLNGQISLATLDMCFSIKRNTLSFGTQAASTVNLTEGYPCVRSRTISLQTVQRYGTSQCGQDRDEFTF